MFITHIDHVEAGPDGNRTHVTCRNHADALCSLSMSARDGKKVN